MERVVGRATDAEEATEEAPLVAMGDENADTDASDDAKKVPLDAKANGQQLILILFFYSDERNNELVLIWLVIVMRIYLYLYLQRTHARSHTLVRPRDRMVWTQINPSAKPVVTLTFHLVVCSNCK